MKKSKENNNTNWDLCKDVWYIVFDYVHWLDLIRDIKLVSVYHNDMVNEYINIFINTKKKVQVFAQLKATKDKYDLIIKKI